MRELSQHILDALENAVEAGASRIVLSIQEDLRNDRMVIEIDDNGRGMDKERVRRALDPFFTTRKTRHVGLGLPLFLEAARRCAGDLTLQSDVGKGTRLRATFVHSHIDRPPLGDIPGALLAILLSERPIDLDFFHKIGSREFRFNSSEIRKELENIPLAHPRVRNWISRFLQEEEASLQAGEAEGSEAIGTLKKARRKDDGTIEEHRGA